MKEVGQRIKNIRKDNKLSQKDFAKLLAIGDKVLSNIESGKRPIKVDELLNIQSSFNIDINWIVSGEGNKEFTKSEKENELLNLILDFRDYGLEIDATNKLIIGKILEKMFPIRWFSQKPEYINRTYITLISILQKIKTNDNEEWSDSKKVVKKNAKNLLLNLISKDKTNKAFEKGVKSEIITAISKLDDRDCYYFIKKPKITISVIESKISIIDKKINNLLNKIKLAPTHLGQY